MSYVSNLTGSVAMSPDVNSTVTAAGASYFVTFRETGLLSGSVWAITLDGSTHNTSGNFIVFLTSLGSHQLAIDPPYGYGLGQIWGPSIPTQDHVNVTGANTFWVKFGPLEYLTFHESGLPNGSVYGVSLRSALAHGGPAPQNWSDVVGSGSPGGIAYDPVSNELFVTNVFHGTVEVFNASSGTFVVTLSVFPATGDDFQSMAYDSRTQGVLVTSLGAAEGVLTVISGINNTLLRQIGFLGGVGAVVYDSGKGEIFVQNDTWFDDRCYLTVLSDTNYSVVATIPLQYYCTGGMAYDAARGEVFIGSGDNVSVVNDTTNRVVANIAAPGAAGIAYDPSRGELWVGSNPDSNAVGRVFVISDSNNSVVTSITVGRAPQGILYDPRTSDVFVANFNGTTFSVISDSNYAVVATVVVSGLTRQFAGPFSIAYDPKTTSVYFSGGDNIVEAISDSSFRIVKVLADPTATNSIVFVVVQGNWKFQVTSKQETFRAIPGRGTVAVPAHGVTKGIAFKPETQVVIFREMGLSLGARWGVSVSGPLNRSVNGTAGALRFVLVNGSYNYTVWNLTSQQPHPAAGTFSVTAPHRAIAILIAYGTAAPATPQPAGAAWLPPPPWLASTPPLRKWC